MELTSTAVGRDTLFGFLDADAPSPRQFQPRLIVNEDGDTMLRAILHELRRSISFVFSVAFVTPGAVATLKQALLEYAGSGTIITSTYLGFNSPQAFEELAALPGIDVLLLDDPAEAFHAKGYLFRQPTGTAAIIGSSNLTESALQRNHEWNLRFSALDGGNIVHQLEAVVARQVARARTLDQDWIDAYRRVWVRPVTHGAPQLIGPVGATHASEQVLPNAMQVEALEQIDLLRSAGERRAVVISATGTGKTILAALDVRRAAPRRMLFVVHREQILDKAIAEFKRVLSAPDEDFGKWTGGVRQDDRRYVFATIQTISRANNLLTISPDAFDYVLIDEVHKAGAQTYRRVIDHLSPYFLLGMTATPERTDGFDVFELFDHNVAYEIRLQKALEADMLAPFHYYGVTDYVDANGEAIDDASRLGQLVAPERVEHLLRAVDTYARRGEPIHGLVFCSGKDEAHELSRLLNARTLRGAPLRTLALTGDDRPEVREAAVGQLERGELDYLLTVDIFNEGIDIPTINQVVMLRQTSSSIVFTQQLGRGLRRTAGKDYLVVIDFIGNYTNNFLIPIALFGDTSLNKDSVRRALIDAREAGSIAGLSSVSFDEISRERVFRALDVAKLDSLANLKAAYTEMANRVGTRPRLIDFARFDTVDASVLANREKNYWRFLRRIGKADAPSERADRLLRLLTYLVLDGKRPHELVLLRTLLDRGELTRAEAIEELARHGCSNDDGVVDSSLRVLDRSFLPAKVHGDYLPVIEVSGDRIRLSAEFRHEWDIDIAFREHVNDVVETGLYLARHRHDWAAGFRVGERYSRRDACRLLNWVSDQTSTVYGYKVDRATATCPIFVTYHKSDEVGATVAYEDELLDETTMRWFTRSRRTLASDEVRAITGNSVAIHVFVKRDDAEGTDFIYLGRAHAHAPKQEHMPDGNGGSVSVVTMELRLARPVPRSLFDYLTVGSVAVPEPVPASDVAHGENQGSVSGSDVVHGDTQVLLLPFDLASELTDKRHP